MHMCKLKLKRQEVLGKKTRIATKIVKYSSMIFLAEIVHI